MNEEWKAYLEYEERADKRFHETIEKMQETNAELIRLREVERDFTLLSSLVKAVVENDLQTNEVVIRITKTDLVQNLAWQQIVDYLKKRLAK